MGVKAGTLLQVDLSDRCRLFQSPYRYVRVCAVGKWVADEPLYVALEQVKDLPDGTEKRVALYLK